jgi:hypothetical protein
MSPVYQNMVNLIVRPPIMIRPSKFLDGTIWDRRALLILVCTKKPVPNS